MEVGPGARARGVRVWSGALEGGKRALAGSLGKETESWEGSQEQQQGSRTPSGQALEKPPGYFTFEWMRYFTGSSRKWDGSEVGVGTHRPKRSTSSHLHENGELGGFSCAVSFSQKVTNCCLEEPNVSLETGCASPRNLPPFRPHPHYPGALKEASSCQRLESRPSTLVP